MPGEALEARGGLQPGEGTKGNCEGSTIACLETTYQVQLTLNRSKAHAAALATAATTLAAIA